jgi:hypothetical protein
VAGLFFTPTEFFLAEGTGPGLAESGSLHRVLPAGDPATSTVFTVGREIHTDALTTDLGIAATVADYSLTTSTVIGIVHGIHTDPRSGRGGGAPLHAPFIAHALAFCGAAICAFRADIPTRAAIIVIPKEVDTAISAPGGYKSRAGDTGSFTTDGIFRTGIPAGSAVLPVALGLDTASIAAQSIMRTESAYPIHTLSVPRTSVSAGSTVLGIGIGIHTDALARDVPIITTPFIAMAELAYGS